MQEFTLNRRKANKKITFTLTDVCLVVMFVCALLTGLVPQTILSIVVLAMLGLLFMTRQVHLAFPIMIFYYEAFGTVAGMSVYRYFSLFFLISVIINKGSILLKKRQLAPIFLFVLYALIVVLPYGPRRAIFLILDIMCVLFFVNSHLDTKEKLEKFFKIYALIALCAFVTGTVVNTSYGALTEIGGQYVEVVRNYATFEDPNYAGFFYTIAIFSTVTLKLFKPKLRVVVVLALTAILLTTLSITALLLNVVLWFVYLVVFKKLNTTAILCILLVAVILLGLYFYGLENRDAPVIGNFSYRIWDKLQSLEQNDLNAVTTNRTGLAKKHMDFFWAQSVPRMLIGMNKASTIITDLDGFTVAAHNEYVDLLLNVGIVGAVVYIGYLILRFMQSYSALRKHDRYGDCVFMIKAIWALYALTLTMFGDYRFMFFFFL